MKRKKSSKGKEAFADLLAIKDPILSVINLQGKINSTDGFLGMFKGSNLAYYESVEFLENLLIQIKRIYPAETAVKIASELWKSRIGKSELRLNEKSINRFIRKVGPSLELPLGIPLARQRQLSLSLPSKSIEETSYRWLEHLLGDNFHTLPEWIDKQVPFPKVITASQLLTSPAPDDKVQQPEIAVDKQLSIPTPLTVPADTKKETVKKSFLGRIWQKIVNPMHRLFKSPYVVDNK